MKIKRIFNFICFFVVVPIAAFFSFDTLIRSFQIHQTIEKAKINTHPVTQQTKSQQQLGQSLLSKFLEYFRASGIMKIV